MNKGDVTYQDKLNELKLDVAHPHSSSVNFILVEGKSDIRLFRKFFNHGKCKVENIPGGKNKLEECVDNLVKKYPLIIGIRDADFIRLNNINYTKTNMFLTDKHDIETTIISETQVLNALVFTNIPENEHLKFRDDILKSIEMVGYLKWLNSRENLKLKFESGFYDLIDFTNLTINFDEYFKRILSKSPNAKITDISLIKTKIDNLKIINPSMLQLTNGHDLLKTFANYFKNISKSEGVSDKNIASILRTSFSSDHFKNTTLYKDLVDWSKKEDIEIFS